MFRRRAQKKESQKASTQRHDEATQNVTPIPGSGELADDILVPAISASSAEETAASLFAQRPAPFSNFTGASSYPPLPVDTYPSSFHEHGGAYQGASVPAGVSAHALPHAQTSEFFSEQNFAQTATPTTSPITPFETSSSATAPSAHDPKPVSSSASGEKKTSVFSVISSLLFYIALVIIFLAAFAFSQKSTSGKEIAGYRFYTVLTTSMNSVIPQGSLIITKGVDTDTLRVGQDITFYKDKETLVTHRIVDIEEGEEHRLFTTKGVDNPSVDEEPVVDENVIGEVVFHIPGLGKALAAIAGNIWWLFAAFLLLVMTSFAIRLIFTKDEGEEGEIAASAA